MIIVDTNIILRYLLQDNEEMSRIAIDIIDNNEIFIPTEVIVEVSYVLRKVYNVEKEKIYEAIELLLDMEDVKFQNSKTIEIAFNSIKKNVENILIPSEERHLYMYPMDFEEFLWAMGNKNLINIIKKCFEEKKPLGQLMHRQAMDYFKQYLIIGGMPQAVEKYVNTKNFKEVDIIKRDILNLYKEDIVKYGGEDTNKIQSIFEEIPSQLQKHEKRFTFTSLNKNARYREYIGAFFWLQESMIVNIAYNTTESNIGLRLNRESSALKCYMGDTGLLLSLAFDENGLMDEDIYKKILFNKLSFNEGMIMENIVAQMIVASGKKLYFYFNYDKESCNDNMEIDFLILKNKITSRHNICPIEVKSGKNYTYTSLKKFNAKYADYLYTNYILHIDDLKEENGIVFLPLYMTGLL